MAAVFRRLPHVRGKDRLSGILHRHMLRSVRPEDAVRWIPMRDGTRLLLDVRSATEWTAYYSGRWEPTLPSILPLILPGTAVLDVGANIGFYTVPLARRLLQIGGRLFAFEPVPSNFARLMENVRGNGLETVVQAYPVALGEANGEISMRLDTRGGALTGNAFRVPALDCPEAPRWPSVSVPLVRLDDYLGQIGWDGRRCSLVKVDIEGSEPLFFRGASQFLREHRPVVLAEVNVFWLRAHGLSVADYYDVLCELRYSTRIWRRGRWKMLENPAEFAATGEFGSFLLLPPEAAAKG